MVATFRHRNNGEKQRKQPHFALSNVSDTFPGGLVAEGPITPLRRRLKVAGKMYCAGGVVKAS